MNLPSGSLSVDTASVRRALLRWFSKHQRKLPWRARDGRAPDPYAVWVSEIMLQQTRAEVVSGYFERWMRSFPNVHALAEADEQEVLSLWQGLGYYSRAKRLHRAARYLVAEHRGELPMSVEALLEIPGIGPYSAGAISSIAFGRPAPLVDGNVVRVFTRLFALPGDPARAPLKKELWRIAAALARGPEPGNLNQALMELGATVCTPKKPACYACPLSRQCLAHGTAEPEDFPHKAPKKKVTPLDMRVALISRRGRVLVEQRPASARWWADMWTFPFVEIPALPGQNAVLTRVAVKELWGIEDPDVQVEGLPPLTHTVTRYRIELTPYRIELGTAPLTLAAPTLAAVGDESPKRRWRRSSELSALPMPAPHRRLAQTYFAPSSS